MGPGRSPLLAMLASIKKNNYQNKDFKNSAFINGSRAEPFSSPYYQVLKRIPIDLTNKNLL